MKQNEKENIRNRRTARRSSTRDRDTEGQKIQINFTRGSKISKRDLARRGEGWAKRRAVSRFLLNRFKRRCYLSAFSRPGLRPVPRAYPSLFSMNAPHSTHHRPDRTVHGLFCVRPPHCGAPFPSPTPGPRSSLDETQT